MKLLLKSLRCVCFIILLGMHSFSAICMHHSEAPDEASKQLKNKIDSLFSARANLILENNKPLRNADYYVCAVKYANGIELDLADSLVMLLLQQPSGDPFWMINSMAIYLHGKSLMSLQVKEAVRNAWKHYAPNRGDTENHWVMYYASLYLASEQWQKLEGTEWFNGKTSEENHREAEEFLLDWMTQTTSFGQMEFDSPHYSQFFLGAMILLHDFSIDVRMKKRASMMLDFLLMDFALDHLEGKYTGGHSRISEKEVIDPAQVQSSGIAALYFGIAAPMKTQIEILCALSDYRVPPIVFAIATDRSEVFINKERKRVRTTLRFTKEAHPPVLKYSYMTPRYAIGSLQGGILQPIQQHTWGINVATATPHATIFGLHPYWSEIELGMFFPEETKRVIEQVVSSKSMYTNENKWTSSSPYEHIMQHKNTLIALYDIPIGTNTEHIDAFFPKTLDTLWHDESGWIMARSGDVFVGWFALQPYNWIEESVNFRMRSYALQNGYVVEVRSEKEIVSFENFLSLLRKRKPRARLEKDAMEIRYRTLDGDQLEWTLGKSMRVNGKEIRFENYPLFGSRFVHSQAGSQIVELQWKELWRKMNFRNWTVQEK